MAKRSGIDFLTWIAPTTSISRMTSLPLASCSWTQALGVPYLLPKTSAVSRKAFSFSSCSNCSLVMKW